jgi:hypothetical protein
MRPTTLTLCARLAFWIYRQVRTIHYLKSYEYHHSFHPLTPTFRAPQRNLRPRSHHSKRSRLPHLKTQTDQSGCRNGSNKVKAHNMAPHQDNRSSPHTNLSANTLRIPTHLHSPHAPLHSHTKIRARSRRAKHIKTRHLHTSRKRNQRTAERMDRNPPIKRRHSATPPSRTAAARPRLLLPKRRAHARQSAKGRPT